MIVKQIEDTKDTIQTRKSIVPDSQTEAKVVKIGKTHAQYCQSTHAYSSDKSVFIKHGEIQDKFTLKLDFIRDLNNGLGLLSEEQHSERYEKICQDTLDQICKFHNI